MGNWLASSWYESCAWLCRLGMVFGFSCRHEGARNIPDTGPALLLANHQSFLDPVVIGSASQRHLCFLARETLFKHPLFSWLIRSFNAVPIDQEGFARAGLQTTIDQLRAGKAVIVFPEGERTPGGTMLPLRPGIHAILKRVRVPIVPIGLAGVYEAWPRWRPYPRLAPLFLPARESGIAISIGEPIDSAELMKKPRQVMLDELFQLLKSRVDRAEQLRRRCPHTNGLAMSAYDEAQFLPEPHGHHLRIPIQIPGATEPEYASNQNQKRYAQ